MKFDEIIFMKKILSKKLKIMSFDLSKKKIITEPLTILKKINLNKLKKITSFSLNNTITKFKQARKEGEINRIKLLKREQIKEAKKIKLEQKKLKLNEAKQVKKDHLQKLKDEKIRLENQQKQKYKIDRQLQQI